MNAENRRVGLRLEKISSCLLRSENLLEEVQRFKRTTERITHHQCRRPTEVASISFRHETKERVKEPAKYAHE